MKKVIMWIDTDNMTTALEWIQSIRDAQMPKTFAGTGKAMVKKFGKK